MLAFKQAAKPNLRLNDKQPVAARTRNMSHHYYWNRTNVLFMLCGLHIHSVSSYLQVHPDLYSMQLSVVIVMQHSIISTKLRTNNNNKMKKKSMPH